MSDETAKAYNMHESIAVDFTHQKQAEKQASGMRFFKKSTQKWAIGGYSIALFALLPCLAILWLALTPEENIWPHLIETMLPRYIYNTSILMLGVGFGTIVGGVMTAWCVTMCDFPGKKIFEWALLLPLAMPAYVIAYVYTDLLEFAGPVQTSLRFLFDWQLKREYLGNNNRA